MGNFESSAYLIQKHLLKNCFVKINGLILIVKYIFKEANAHIDCVK